MTCQACNKSINDGEEYVALPINPGASIKVAITKGNYKFWHYKHSKKSPELRNLPVYTQVWSHSQTAKNPQLLGGKD